MSPYTLYTSNTYIHHICFIKLSWVHTLGYQNKKVPKVGVAPLCLMRCPPSPKRSGKRGYFESKSVWLIIKIRYPWNTEWVCYGYLAYIARNLLETLSESVMCIYIARSLHRTIIGFKIVWIFSLNTIETLSGPLCPPFSHSTWAHVWGVELLIVHRSTVWKPD